MSLERATQRGATWSPPAEHLLDLLWSQQSPMVRFGERPADIGERERRGQIEQGPRDGRDG